MTGLTKVLKEQSTVKPKHSTFQVKPTVRVPMLGDDGPDSHDIQDFFDKFEDMCGLANDGSGMLPAEHLRTLGQSLKGAKLKTYDVAIKKARKLGYHDNDPDRVFQEIKDRLMRFSETPLQRQLRVSELWNNMSRGSKTGLQWEVEFEDVIGELEVAGLGKSALDLKIGYLQKAGPQYHTDILKDTRAWPGADGTTTIRKVETWEECHVVLLELETAKSGGKALANAYPIDGGKMTKAQKSLDSKVKKLQN